MMKEKKSTVKKIINKPSAMRLIQETQEIHPRGNLEARIIRSISPP